MQSPNATGDPQVLAKLGVGKSRTFRRWLGRAIALLVLLAAIQLAVIFRGRLDLASAQLQRKGRELRHGTRRAR